MAAFAPAGVGAAEQSATRLPVAVTVDVTSRFADQRFILTGWIEVIAEKPRLEQGVSVFDLRVETVHLQGASQLGVIFVTERPDAGKQYVSRGEVRAMQPGGPFPAASYIDLYADIVVPKSILGGALAFHNEAPLRLAPEGPLMAWPPLDATYQMAALLDFDNDADGSVDEDTADEDGDVYVDEDRPGPDPETPGLPPECGNDADCDGADGEDPPPTGCGPACDDDADGQVDEDPNCLPLLNEGNTSLPLGVCMTGLVMETAPATPSFSIAAGGPARMHPADVLGLLPGAAASETQAPYVQIPCGSLGLSATGCDDGSDGTQDDLDGLSYGFDLGGGPNNSVLFSVGPGGQGLPGSAVEGQYNCPPASPGLAPEADGDIFSSGLNGSNALLFDGNGPIGACTVGFPLGLVEAATRRDDLDAIGSMGVELVDPDGDGIPDEPVYFSLAASSASLETLGAGPGDILVTQGGGSAQLYASAEQLGLGAGDDLDAFCLREDGNGIYSAADLVYYSIAPRLAGPAGNVGPSDILAPGMPPRVIGTSGELGLRVSDDLDALECQMLTASAPNGDVTCEGVTNAIDALYVLQFDAQLLPTLPCPANGDMSRDGRTNSLDASLILQFAAGLIGYPT